MPNKSITSKISIKQDLLKRLGYSFLLITLIATITINIFINYAINQYFDNRLKHESEDIINRLYIEKSQIKFKNKHLGINLQTSAGDSSVFYSIKNSSGVLLFGFNGIPRPSKNNFKQVLYDAEFFNHKMRIFSTYHTILRNKHTFTTIITIAETLEDRKNILYKIYAIFTIITIFIIAGTILSTLFAIDKGLRPLEAIQNSIRKRDANDLTFINENKVPIEIISIVRSINQLFEKLKKSFLNVKQFNADVSHQLKTPLSELKIYLDLDESIDKEQKILYLENINTITHTIDQLLLHAHTSPDTFDSTQFKPFNLTKLCKTIAMRKAPILYQNRFDIIFKAEDVFWIYGEHAIIESLLNNLIDNAQKYAYNKRCNENTITLHLEDKDNRVIINILDNGPGIPKESINKVFDRFVRLNKHKKGTGLGLSIVKQIVELHNGTIRLSNKKPCGLHVAIEFRKYQNRYID